MKPEFIKIWVDDRGGTKKKLTPELYLAIIDEAHKLNLPVAAHNVTLADAKLLMKAGVEGWLHLPVRMGEVPDAELLAIIRDRIARKDRPNMWFHPNVGTAFATREDWNDPLLRETVPPQQIQQLWGEQLARITPESVSRGRESLKQLGATNALKLRDAGMKIILGSDTGQTRFFIGWMGQLEFESWVYMGLTPMQAIVAATRIRPKRRTSTPEWSLRASWRILLFSMRIRWRTSPIRGGSTRSTCGARKWIAPRCGPNGRSAGLMLRLVE